MSIQYPAGTGFDPRMQRPKGQNVGQIGNIYLPQEEPQEQDNGIDAGDVIGTLAALAGAGALGLAGYRNVAGRNLWDRPNPATATAATQKTYTRPETQVRQAAARPSYGELWDRTTGPISSRPTEASISTRLLPAAPGTVPSPIPAQRPTYGELWDRTTGSVVTPSNTSSAVERLLAAAAGSTPGPLDPWSTPRGTVVGQPFADEGARIAGLPDLWPQSTGALASTLDAMKDQIAQDTTVIDTGRVGNITRNLNKPTLTEVQAQTGSKYTPEYDLETLADEIIDDLAKEKAAEQIVKDLAAEKVLDTGASVPVAETPQAQDFLDAYTESQSSSAVPVALTARTKPIRLSGEVPVYGQEFNYGGKKQTVIGRDKNIIVIEDGDGQLTPLRMLEDGEPYQETEISIEPFVKNEDVAAAQLSALGKLGAFSSAKDVAKTMGIALPDARKALAIQYAKAEAEKPGTFAGRRFQPPLITDFTDDDISASDILFAQYKEKQNANAMQRLIRLQEDQNSGDIPRREIAAMKKAEKMFDVGEAENEKVRPKRGLLSLGDDDRSYLGLEERYEEILNPDGSIEAVRKPVLGGMAALQVAATQEFGISPEVAKRLVEIDRDMGGRLFISPYSQMPEEAQALVREISDAAERMAQAGTPETVVDFAGKNPGELAQGSRKGLPFNPNQDPSTTRVRGLKPGRTRISSSKKRHSAQLGGSVLGLVVRNSKTGELGSPQDFGISHGRGASGTSGAGISDEVMRFATGFEPTVPIILTKNIGSSKNTVRPDADVVSSIGETDFGVRSKEDYQVQSPLSNTDLIQALLEGKSVIDTPGSPYVSFGEDDHVKRNPYYNQTKPITLTPEGIVESLGSVIRVDKNGIPFLMQGKSAFSTLASSKEASKADMPNYAPVGLTKSGVRVQPEGRGPNVEMPPTNDADKSLGMQISEYLQSVDPTSLNEEQRAAFNALTATPITGTRLAALGRSYNAAAENANTAGERANQILAQGLTREGVPLGKLFPELTGRDRFGQPVVPNGDFYAAMSTGRVMRDELGNITGTRTTDSIPQAIGKMIERNQVVNREAPVEGQPPKPEIPIGQSAYRDILKMTGAPIKQLSGTIRNIKEYAKQRERAKQQNLINRGLRTEPVEQDPDVSINLLTEFITDRGDNRTEVKQVQAPTTSIHEGIMVETDPEMGGVISSATDKDLLTYVRNLPQNQNQKQIKANANRELENRKRTRASALDKINKALNYDSERTAAIEEEAIKERAANIASRDSLDAILRAVREDKEIPTVTRTTQDGKQIKVLKDRNALDALTDLEEMEANYIPVGEKGMEDLVNDLVYGRTGYSKDAETNKIVDEYRTKIAGGTKLFRPITINSEFGSTTIDNTDANIERLVRGRYVVDPSFEPNEKGKRPRMWIGDSTVTATPETLRHYWMDAPIRSNYEDLADKNLSGLMSMARDMDVSPQELQIKILDNPDDYPDNLVKEARKNLPDKYEYYPSQARGGTGMPITPVLARAAQMGLTELGLPTSKVIEDYIQQTNLRGYQYSGNNPVRLLGEAATATLTGQGGGKVARLRIQSPDSYTGGGIPDRDQRAFAQLQSLIRDKQSDIKVTENAPVTTQLGEVLFQTKDLDEDPIRDTLFYKKEDGRFGLTEYGQKLKSLDRYDRPGLYGKAVDMTLPREKMDAQRGQRKQQRKANKAEAAQELLARLANTVADQNPNSASQTILQELNAALGKTETPITDVGKAIQRAARKANAGQPGQANIVPGVEYINDGAGSDGIPVATAGIEQDPYETIVLPKTREEANVRRAKISQVQEQNRNQLVRSYLANVESQTGGNRRQVALITPDSILRQAGMSLSQFIDTFGVDPTTISRSLNSRTKEGARRSGPISTQSNTGVKITNLNG